MSGVAPASGSVPPPELLKRFPNAHHRKVEKLAKVRIYFWPALGAIYLAGALVAMPFLLGLDWYTNDAVTDVGFYFCAFILALPLVGFTAGFALLQRCATVSRVAEKIDGRTQSLFDEPALLERSRETLLADYAGVAEGTPIVDALRSDALRRALVDRWEPSSWLVDAQWSELSRGLPLIVTLQRLALQLGILFTFIGLAVAFSSDAFGSVSEVRAIQNLDPLIEALQVKFMASIAGLVASISMLVLGWACRRELSKAVTRLEVMVDNILTLAKAMRGDLTFGSDLSQVRESVQRLDNRVDGLRTGYHEIVATIRNGISDLAATRREFEDKLATLLETERRVVAEIDSFYGRLSPQGLSEHLGTVLNESMAVFSQRLASSSEAVASLNDAVNRLAAAERERAKDQARENEHQEKLLNAIRALNPKPWTGGG